MVHYKVMIWFILIEPIKEKCKQLFFLLVGLFSFEIQNYSECLKILTA